MLLAEKVFRRFNAGYLPRWIVYEETLLHCITKDTVWLDIGCGKNENVANLGHIAKEALGIDALDSSDRTNAPFLQANIRNIPLPSAYASLITLRLVVEHLENVHEDFTEVCRLLKQGGRLIILTTNRLSPIVFFPSLLPYILKSWLIQTIYGVKSDDVFPTYHRFNTPMKIAKGIQGMSLLKIDFLEQVSLDNFLLMLIFGTWYSIVKLSPLKYFRSNIIAVFQKSSI